MLTLAEQKILLNLYKITEVILELLKQEEFGEIENKAVLYCLEYLGEELNPNVKANPNSDIWSLVQNSQYCNGIRNGLVHNYVKVVDNAMVKNCIEDVTILQHKVIVLLVKNKANLSADVASQLKQLKQEEYSKANDNWKNTCFFL